MIFWAANADAQSVPSDVRTKIAESVVKIIATDCNGEPSKSGTGFVFENQDRVVTALHVVANCDRLDGWFEREDGGPRRRLRLERVLPGQDLALLTIDSPTSQPPLAIGNVADIDEPLSVLGYALDQLTLQDWPVNLGIGTNEPPDGTSTLEEMLDAATAKLIANGSPIEVWQRVMRLSSPLQPGTSGGPIFDSRGQVIGIVGGGLRRGVAPVSWGWPSSSLAELLDGDLAGDTSFDYDQDLYSTPSEETAPSELVLCGELEFSLVERRKFRELADANDDPARVAIVAAASGLPLAELGRLEFDIWRHSKTGATVAVPNDHMLEQIGGRCEVNSSDGRFRLVVVGRAVSGRFDIQNVSMQFENQIAQEYLKPWLGAAPDQVLTTMGPQEREDSFVVNRKGILWWQSQSFGGNPPTAVHGFETIMARDESFVGIFSINENYWFPPAGCFSPAQQGCSPPFGYLQNFAHFIFSTQLSTYPIY